MAWNLETQENCVVLQSAGSLFHAVVMFVHEIPWLSTTIKLLGSSLQAVVTPCFGIFIVQFSCAPQWDLRTKQALATWRSFSCSHGLLSGNTGYLSVSRRAWRRFPYLQLRGHLQALPVFSSTFNLTFCGTSLNSRNRAFLFVLCQ